MTQPKGIKNVNEPTISELDDSELDGVSGGAGVSGGGGSSAARSGGGGSSARAR
jgi:hypothetical protein